MLGRMKLRAEEARVLGSLVEKELTTPQQYPLTVASLVSACNQSSNRDPVVDYDEATVISALDSLKQEHLVRFVLPSHGRSAVRYRHVLDEALGIDRRQCALLAVLLLRGPQTPGELRVRTDRMAEFDGLEQVEHELGYMASLSEPLAASLGRRPGQKEERWSCPLMAPPPDDAVPSEPPAPAGLDAVHSELALIRSEVDQLRADLSALRSSLGE
jgi:uncharacterized protein